MIKVGDAVIYIDEDHQTRDALIQSVHNQDYVNLIVVSKDVAMTDQYGRQIAHATSVPRKTELNAAGRHFIERT